MLLTYKNNIIKNTILQAILIFLILITLSYRTSAEQINYDVRTVNWNKLKENSQQILNIDKDDVLANFQYTISLANLGMIEEAFDYIEMIKDNISINKFNRKISPHISRLENNPNDILLLNYAAFSASINSKNENSIPYFKRILDLEPKNIWIRNFLAAAYIDIEEYDNAKKEVKKALEIQDNQYSHLILGYIYYESGNFIRALIELGRSGDLGNRILFDK